MTSFKLKTYQNQFSTGILPGPCWVGEGDYDAPQTSGRLACIAYTHLYF